MDMLAAVEGFHTDLQLLADQSSLSVVDRLLADFDNHVEALRKLLDRKPKSAESRNQLATGKVKIDDVEYDLNDEFKANAIELSDILGVDEIEACTLLTGSREAPDEFNRGPVATAVIRFHSHRTFLVDCLRLLLKIVLDDDQDNDIRNELKKRFESILQASAGRKPGPAFTQKCLASMLDNEQWLNRIADQIQKMITVGQVSSSDQDEVMGLQQQHLALQHESLGAIITYLIKLEYSSIEDLKQLLRQMQNLDKWNTLVIHYVPIVIAFFSMYGSAHGTTSHSDSRIIYKMLVDALECNSWPLRQLQGAVVIWWLAEYNSWYFDMPEDHIDIEDEDREKEATLRNDTLNKALDNGAFQCTLSICSQLTSNDWYDSARLGLITSLLNDSYVLPTESASMSEWFVTLVFEHLEFFTFSFIQTMPNTLRNFKTDEEDQRRQYLASLSANIQNDIQEPDKHLERFFVIMSYAYEGRSEAANAFWEDTDSHLYGFLQWFSRRVSTPLVGAFCEMFRSISEGEEYANAAHAFLSDASQAATSRARRASSLSWDQIFEELEFYAAKVKGSPTPAITGPAYGIGKTKSIDVDEPETPVMLESYLRLIAHLCSQSATVRDWMLSQTRCKIIDTVFSLSNSSVPSRIRACAYSVLTGLLKARTPDISTLVWISLDQWVVLGYPSSRTTRVTNSTTWAGDITFDTITSDFEEMNAFLDLLCNLTVPPTTSGLYDGLAFPESLGSSYRMPGIDPYIDFVLGRILAQKALTFDHLKSRILCSKIFTFIRIVFDSFNENLLTLAQKTGQSLDEAIEATTLNTYIQLHPFSRVMEWMFNEKVLVVLFSMAHQDISEVTNTVQGAPLNSALLGAIEVMNQILRLQATYLDVVRPLIKTQSAVRRQAVSNPSLASFEDAVSVHLRIITDLAYYGGTANEDLALPSLQLLKQLSRSRKLNSSQASKIGSQVLSNRLVSILQGNNDVEPISKAFGGLLTWDERELEGGASMPRFRIKFAILDFIEETLRTNPEAPNLAHALLGFRTNGSTLFISDDGDFVEQVSMFHRIASIGLNYPCAVDGSLEFALLNLKTKALNIIHLLWTARLTSSLVLAALTEFPYLDILWLNSPVVGTNTLWQDLPYDDPDFQFSDGIRGFECFLRQRHFLYSHVASQIRVLALESSLTARARLVATTFGSSEMIDELSSGPTIFDFLDFLDLDIPEPALDVSAPLMGDEELFESCKAVDVNGIEEYNLQLLEQLLALRANHLQRIQAVVEPTVIDKLTTEKADILAYYNGLNNLRVAKVARIAALRAWGDLLVIIIRQGGLLEADKASIVIQALQIMSPKLELYMGANRPETYIFAHLIQILVGELDLKSTALAAGRAGQMARERLFELFKICLRATADPVTTAELRDSLYNICYRYLVSVGSQTEAHRTSTMQAVRAAGEAVIETISEDAYSAAGTSSIGALLLLDALARLAMEDKSTYVIESLTHNNFVLVLIESLQGMLPELDRASKSDIPLLLTNYKAKLSLLLTIASTRAGANQITSAGLFASIRASGLFSTDPDLGLDLDNPAALQQFYELILAVLRIVAATIISRGPQNKQTVDQARAFLHENRPLMLGVLKRESKVVRYEQELKIAAAAGLEEVLEELVEVYMVVIAATEFLEFEEENAKSRTSIRGRFS